MCDLKSPYSVDNVCDVTCGGGGCDSCGMSDSCTNGALGKVNSAITITEEAENIAINKTMKAQEITDKVILSFTLVLLI